MYEEFTAFIAQLININICLKKDFVLELIDKFDIPIKKLNYPNNNLDNLSISLNFYKGFNLEYYNIIRQGLNSQNIMISDECNSYVDTKSSKAYIKLNDNDGDVIILVHEFAHYIDRMLNPHIVPDKYWFLGESFAFYMERELEKKLGQKYEYLFEIRKNNRLYTEKKLLQIIKLALYYENEYLKTGKLELKEEDSKNIKRIMNIGHDNLVNFCLSYPIANITSLYLINFCSNITREEFCKLCLSYDIKKFFKDNRHLIGLDNKIKIK